MVKRYDLFVEKNEIREFHNGDYVSFTDYEMLDIEREALAERCERLEAASVTRTELWWLQDAINSILTPNGGSHAQELQALHDKLYAVATGAAP